jgi:hypothetical protein
MPIPNPNCPPLLGAWEMHGRVTYRQLSDVAAEPVEIEFPSQLLQLLAPSIVDHFDDAQLQRVGDEMDNSLVNSVLCQAYRTRVYVR